ncbi:MAG: hypothetical protein ACXAEU_08850 [Candidatus Hodarchaeales archaeon]
MTNKTSFSLDGYIRCKILKPRWRAYYKLTAGVKKHPFAYRSCLGNIIATARANTKEKAWKKVNEILSIFTLGRLTSEGCGAVKWLHGSIKPLKIRKNDQKERKITVRIRKSVPQLSQGLDKKALELVRYALLHDFFHSDHSSKIYHEVPILDKKFANLCRRHHKKNTQDLLIKEFQYFDRLSAALTRIDKSPTEDRYRWQHKNEQLDFKQIADDIARADRKGIWKLYEYIYYSEELDMLNESMSYGHNSLKRHVLVAVNLIINDKLAKRRKQHKNG